MKKRKFGRTDLHVSELCLNTASFGWLDDDAAAFALLDAYRAAGGGFIQSVGICSDPETREPVQHVSEAMIGRWWQARAIPRDELVLATRLRLSRPRRGGGLALANLMRECCAGSLRRLRTNRLDLLICDWDEHLVPVDDVMDAVDLLIRAGVVRHVVANGFPPWRVVDALHRSRLRNRCRFEGVQVEYSLLAGSRFRTETLDLCREFRLGLIASSPLAGGFLAQHPPSIRELVNLDRGWLDERFGSRRGDATLKLLSQMARQRGATPAQVALAWVLRNPQVTSVVVSASSPAHLGELARTVDLELTEEETRVLTNAASSRGHWTALRHT